MEKVWINPNGPAMLIGMPTLSEWNAKLKINNQTIEIEIDEQRHPQEKALGLA